VTFGLLLITGQRTHQENYARALAADPRCRLIGLTDAADVSPKRAAWNRELADELQIPCLPDLDEALADDTVHAVSVCAEPERRGPLTVRCAAAGKHLYLDKEPAATLTEVSEVIETVREARVISQTFSLVRNNLSQRARQLIESGELGPLRGLHCEMFFAKGFPRTAALRQPRVEQISVPRLTFPDSKRELLCVGWYPLVLFQWLTGEPLATVWSTTANYFFGEHQRNNVEDFATLLGQSATGVHLSLQVGRTGWPSHPGFGIQQLTLVGEQRTAQLDAYSPRLEIYSTAAIWSPPPRPHPEDPMGFWTSSQNASGVRPKSARVPIIPSVADDARHFWDCVEQGRASDVTAELGADVLSTIYAAYESAATGRWITPHRPWTRSSAIASSPGGGGAPC